MLYIGVDLGTSAVKLLLMDEKGNIHKIVSKEYPLFFPHPGWSEQNPEDWFEKSMEGLKELVDGEERERINAAFDRLAEVMRKQGTLAKAFVGVA